MSHSLPPCPACASTLTYEDGDLLICPECGHEWSAAAAAEQDDDALVVKDANGNLLFSNWLNYYVYQATPYDISLIK